MLVQCFHQAHPGSAQSINQLALDLNHLPPGKKGTSAFLWLSHAWRGLKWLCYSSSQHGTEVESSAPLYMTPSKAETTGGLRMPCRLLGFIHIKKSIIKNVFGVKPHTTSAYQIINPAVYSQMASPQVSCLNSSDELDPKRSWVCFLDYERRWTLVHLQLLVLWMSEVCCNSVPISPPVSCVSHSWRLTVDLGLPTFL